MIVKEQEKKDILGALEEIEVVDDEARDLVEEVVRDAKKTAKEIEKEKKKVTDPLNQALKQVRAWFKPIETVLKDTEALGKRKIAQYVQAQRKAKEEAMRAVAEAKTFDEKMRASAGLSVETDMKGTSVRTVWKYKVVDSAKVPREFLAVSDVAVKEYIKSFGKAKPQAISGIEFIEESTVTVR